MDGKYDDWFLEFQKLAVFKYDFCLYATLTLDKVAYKQYFDANYTPEEAMLEDLSYGDYDVTC